VNAPSATVKTVASPARTLLAILRMRTYRRLAASVSLFYLILFMVALQDISLGGTGFQVLTTDWSRAFDRTGTFTFEPIAQLTVPGVTMLLSPINFTIGAILSLLVGLNLMVTYIAFKQPRACGFNRSTGILASLPALLAGSACCAPVIILILGLQLSSLMVAAFQVLIPVSGMLLLLTLSLILKRTNPDLIVGFQETGFFAHFFRQRRVDDSD
jgi:hypothetical protein